MSRSVKHCIITAIIVFISPFGGALVGHSSEVPLDNLVTTLPMCEAGIYQGGVQCIQYSTRGALPTVRWGIMEGKFDVYDMRMERSELTFKVTYKGVRNGHFEGYSSGIDGGWGGAMIDDFDENMKYLAAPVALYDQDGVQIGQGLLNIVPNNGGLSWRPGVRGTGGISLNNVNPADIAEIRIQN